MDKKEFRGEYLAPQVKVVEMQARQQILQSSGDITNMFWNDSIDGDSGF